MVKNSLEIHRKLKKHHQGIKVTKRQILIRIGDLDSSYPDLTLGTYLAKSNASYTLYLRVELPKQTALRIDVWGCTPRLQHINQACVTSSSTKDVKIKYHTYPKTKYVFYTFQLEQELEDPVKTQYTIGYPYLESKYSLPKGVDSPTPDNIKYPMRLDFDIECHPKSLMEIDLVNPLGKFKLPINMKIFEASLIAYLLKREIDPNYEEALIGNLSNCKVPINLMEENVTEWLNVGVTAEDLIEMRSKINDMYKELELKLTQIDSLIEHKYSIENMLDKPDETVDQKNEYEMRLEFYQKLIESLNLKRSHVQRLMQLLDDKKLGESDKRNISEILHYYENRILEDQSVIQIDHDVEEKKWKAFQHEVLSPTETRLSQQQNSLDDILQNYRKNQEICTDLKQKLDSMISRFILLWYQWIIKLNIQSATENIK